ncbi:hypothetical protein [Dactylosporangium sp. NPDC050588]|uniref:hypothetical protein n=1 Tax=Dactylosporangium sp. NPDC050588 TaxID=3157211 RepID=UPI0033D3DB53
MQRPWTNGELLVMVAVGWVVGAGLLLLAWRSDVEDERLRTAPQCTHEQEFTPARCLAELDGTLASVTTNLAQVDVAGRRLTMSTNVKHPPNAGDRPVRVTFYRGEPIRIEADHVRIETNERPADDRWICVALAALTVVGSTGTALGALARRRSPAAA